MIRAVSAAGMIGTARASVKSSFWILLALVAAPLTGCGNAGSHGDSSPIALNPAQGEEVQLWLSSGESTVARVWSNGHLERRIGILFVSGVNGGYEEPADSLYD